MDEQDKWYELRTRNNIRAQQWQIFCYIYAKNNQFIFPHPFLKKKRETN